MLRVVAKLNLQAVMASGSRGRGRPRLATHGHAYTTGAPRTGHSRACPEMCSSSSRGSAGANLESSPGSRCNRALPRCAVFVGEARLDSANGARTQPLLRTQPNFHHGVASAWKLSLVRQLPAAHTCAAQACICHYSFQTRHVHTCTPAHMNAHTRTHTRTHAHTHTNTHLNLSRVPP